MLSILFAADAELAEDAEDCKFAEDYTEIGKDAKVYDDEEVVQEARLQDAEVSKIAGFLVYD
jgi:hypothetical protein